MTQATTSLCVLGKHLCLLLALAGIAFGRSASSQDRIFPPVQEQFAEAPTINGPCDFCTTDRVPLGLQLNCSHIDSIGRSFTAHNIQVIAVADSLYRSGFFGSPQSVAGQRRARAYVQLRNWNAFRYIADLALNGDRVRWIQGDGTFTPFLNDYANTAIFPMKFIHSFTSLNIQ